MATSYYLRPDSSNSVTDPSSSRRQQQHQHHRIVNSAFSQYADSATIPPQQRERGYRGSGSSYYSQTTSNTDFLDLFESSKEDMREPGLRIRERGVDEGSESTQQLQGRPSTSDSDRISGAPRRSGDSRGKDAVVQVNTAASGGGEDGGHGGHHHGHVHRPLRTGFNLWKMARLAFLGNCKMSTIANCLFPVIPIAIAFRYSLPEQHLWIFILNYLAMVPAANLLSYAGEQLTENLPHSVGVVLQLLLASVNELVLMILLLFRNEFQVIQAAIIGSVLANLLLVTGTCFVVGGIRYTDQKFDHMVAETGGSLLLMTAVGLLIPTAFAKSIPFVQDIPETNMSSILGVSRTTSILLLVSYGLHLLFQLTTHRFLFDKLLYKADLNSDDYHEDARRERLSRLEAAFLTAVTLTFVTFHALFLVEQIHWIVVHRNISDAFMGLILVPLVEKVAEHINAVNEAWDNAMDIALSHVLGSTIQTSLFVAPIIVIVGWAFNKPFDLNFDIYIVIVYFLAVLVMGNFIKDRQSNYLEGALSIIFYAIIAVTTFFYPNPPGFGEHH